MGNKQSSKLNSSEDKLSSFKLVIQIDDNSTELISVCKNKIANEEFVYFNLNKPIDFLLNKDISITYINHLKDFYNIFKFNIQLRDSKLVVIHKTKYHELEYKSIPPIEKTETPSPISKLFCRYVSLDINNISFIVSSPVLSNPM